MSETSSGRLYTAITGLSAKVDAWQSDHKGMARDLATVREDLSTINKALARAEGARLEERVQELERRPSNGQLEQRVTRVESWAQEGGLIDNIRVKVIRFRGWVGGLSAVAAILSVIAAIKAFLGP